MTVVAGHDGSDSGDDAAVMESVGSGRSCRLLVDQEFEWQPRAAQPIAGPVGEQAGRRAGIADQPNMGAAIGNPAHRIPVYQHLVDDVEVAVAVVLKSVHQQGPAALLQKKVESELEGVPMGGPSPVCDAGPELGLIVQISGMS